jgi:hypothetical protein
LKKAGFTNAEIICLEYAMLPTWGHRALSIYHHESETVEIFPGVYVFLFISKEKTTS